MRKAEGPTKAIDLTVSIVNHRNRELLEQCLQSIFENTRRINMEVYVVDNASADGSVQMVHEKFPQVRLLINKERLGFSANHNQVLKQAASRYSLILNEDTVILPEALDKMVEFMDTHPQAGALGCKLLDKAGTVQPSCFKFYSLRTVFLDYCLVPRSFHKSRHVGIYQPQELNQAVRVDWVLGACLVLRGEAIKAVGFLDESLFMYSEEVDWCYRAKQKGWKVYFTPHAQVIHYGGQATKHQAEKMLIQLYRSRYLFFKKHYGWVSAYLLRVLISVAALWNTFFLFLCFFFKRIEKKELFSKVEMYWNVARLQG